MKGIMKRYGVPVLIVVAAAAVMVVLSSQKKGQRRAPPAPVARVVQVGRVAAGVVRPAIEGSGRVRPLEQVSLAPEVAGIVEPTDFRLRKGMTFAKGQILLRIDDRQARYSLQGTISDLLNALTAMLPELKTDLPEAYERWRHFFSQLTPESLPSLPEPGSEREKLLANRLNVYKLYYSAKSQQLTVAKHTIVAPFSGTVIESEVYPAAMARAGVPAAQLARTDRVEIELALTVDEARMVRAGTEARVMVQGSREGIEGRVDRISDVLDERMQTRAAFVRVDNASARNVRSGDYAAVTLEGAMIEGAVPIPRKALHDRNKVYVVEADTLAERLVEVAYTGLDVAYVTGGLAEGADVVQEALQDAVVGMAVRPAGGGQDREHSSFRTTADGAKGENRKQRAVQ